MSYPKGVRFTTYAQAADALAQAMLDVEADFGSDTADAAFNDTVRSIAADCTPEVAAELLRRQGIQA
jgi:hypothetical protein